MEFQGNRIFTPADEGKFSIIADGQYQQRGLFTMKGGAQLTIEAPARFSTTGSGNALEVGVGGDAVFVSSNATVSVDRLRVGGLPGSVGAFVQDGGRVTAAAESWIGYDSGTGTLHVANGEFRVSGANLRIALSVGDQGGRSFRPHGIVNVTNGLVYANTLNFTPWFPTDQNTGNALANILHGQVNLFEGGLMDISDINKNDSSLSEIFFDGGTLRIRNSSLLDIGNLAALKFSATDGKYITLDLTNADAVIRSTLGGRIMFTGPGGLRKIGNGRFSFFAHQADYLGDTIIEAGTLRTLGDNLLPSGPGRGNLVLAATNTFLDLYGRNINVNKITGVGSVTNASDAPATLNVLVDGTDDTWTRPYVSAGAAVNLVKQGGGTLTLRETDTITAPVFTVQDGTVRLIKSLGGYPFYRFKIEAVKNTSGIANSMQLAQIALYNGAENVVPNRIGVLYDSSATDGGTFPTGERPEMCINGFVPFDHLIGPPSGTLTNNKWLDFRAAHDRLPVDRERVWLRLQFPDPQPLTAYNWATANDTPDRDPADWRLQGSRDGDNWTDVDVQTGFNATGFRNTWVTENGFPLQIVEEIPVISANTVVVIGQDGRLEVTGGLPQPIGTLAGTGSLVLEGTDIILGGAATPGAFYGTISGNGNVILQGDNQTLNALNTATGDFTVRSGTTTLTTPEANHRWFRFTILDTRAYTNCTQFSEFALYAADGSRCNLGLTQGTSATALNPGQFWTPAYQLGNPNTETAAALFDNNTGTKWCLVENWMKPEYPETWRTITMRLTDNTHEVMSYNLCTANDTNERDPITWMLESSADGINWQIVDARTDFDPTTDRRAWYNNGAPFQFLLNHALSSEGLWAIHAVPDNAIVEVASGATLAVIGGQQAIGALRVDMIAGAGTITRFTPAANGTLHLANTTGAPSSWVIPITFGSVDNPSALVSWQVIADGVTVNGYRLFYDPSTGILSLKPQGTILIVK